MSPFEAYPIYLKAKDVADALQICETSAREMMKRSGVEVACGRTGKSKRVPRDKFFQWVISLEGKANAVGDKGRSVQ